MHDDRSYDDRRAAMLTRAMIGWAVMSFCAFCLFAANCFLMIRFPKVDTTDTIIGLVISTIMVVGTTANLMGYFYEER